MSLSEDKEAELQALKVWCDELVGYVVGRESSAKFLESFKIPVLKNFEKGDVRALKKIQGELSEWLDDLPKAEREKLEIVLMSKSGLSVAPQNDEVERVILAGHISSDEEFRMLNEHMDALVAADGEGVEAKVSVINSMMRKYDKSKRGSNLN